MNQAFVPPKPIDIFLDNDLGNVKPKDTEIRLIGIDYAFANTTSRTKNDATQIMCMSLHWKNKHFERHIDYIEGHEASDSIGANNRFRELCWDFSMGSEFYAVCDLRSGGETLFNRMTIPWKNPDREGFWDERGFGIATNLRLHVATEAKLADLRNRTIDANAVSCVVPIIGSPELNSACWVSLKKNLELNNIKFLISPEDKQTQLEDSGVYYKITSEELADILYPHYMTENLIQEAVGLTSEIRENRIRLHEVGSNTKDLIVLLSYLSYIADKLENEYNKYFYEEEHTDDNELLQLVF